MWGPPRSDPGSRSSLFLNHGKHGREEVHSVVAEEFLCNHTLRSIQYDVPAVEADTLSNQILEEI